MATEEGRGKKKRRRWCLTDGCERRKRRRRRRRRRRNSRVTSCLSSLSLFFLGVGFAKSKKVVLAFLLFSPESN